ncbi:hypothetical protein ET445_10805 [Agromyces protaetiae]|uniref:FHA domain-containing protein n=1 Tax=Agromyces protaetiae TaxID=2509455 RepID=A0A4P6FFB4_9MICO|nr:hypothetical protein [Agromyces protaetiae]QAY73763.1 hypothetical protein ET445_10805 [Agromyces protaetiae]
MHAVNPLKIEFCGEWYPVEAGRPFGIGRDADLVVDENPYLHRTFLTITDEHGLWWLSNVGQLLSATVSDSTGSVQAWLAPGAKLPIVFQTLHVMFSAGPTTYDLTIHAEADYYGTSLTAEATPNGTTVMPVTLTASQRLLVLAMCEHVLAQPTAGRGVVPSSAEAAERLGWSMTTFNRKLDNVCEKLDKLGVDGLRGGKGKLATNRRARLVEYAVATRLVSAEDLPLLDRKPSGGA